MPCIQRKTPRTSFVFTTARQHRKCPEWKAHPNTTWDPDFPQHLACSTCIPGDASGQRHRGSGWPRWASDSIPIAGLDGQSRQYPCVLFHGDLVSMLVTSGSRVIKSRSHRQSRTEELHRAVLDVPYCNTRSYLAACYFLETVGDILQIRADVQ